MTVSAALDVHQPGVHVELTLDQRPPALLPDQPPGPAVQLPEHGRPVRVWLQSRVYGHGLRQAPEAETRVIVLPVRVGLLRVLGVPRAGVVSPGLGVDAVLGVDAHPVVAVLHSAKVQVRGGTEEPAIELAEDVEDVLGEVLVLVHVAAVESLARVGICPHPVPLPENRRTRGSQDDLLTALDSLSLSSPGKPGQLLLPDDQASIIRGRCIVTPRSVKVVNISSDVT